MKKLKTQKELLTRRPTSYRKRFLKLENEVIGSAAQDKRNYKAKLMQARNTHSIFKHHKSLNKFSSLPKLMAMGNLKFSDKIGRANLVDEFFHSVFSSKSNLSIEDCRTKNSKLTNFCISKKQTSEFLSSSDVSKSRGPGGIPSSFF